MQAASYCESLHFSKSNRPYSRLQAKRLSIRINNACFNEDIIQGYAEILFDVIVKEDGFYHGKKMLVLVISSNKSI